MLRKLISNLPYNPSLVHQIAFYTGRMKAEAGIRRIGLIFMALAVCIQFFAVAAPPKPSLASSTNDIINGGFQTRDQAVSACRTNRDGFGGILAYYRVSCDKLATASTRSIRSTDYAKRLDSLGRRDPGPVITRTGKPTDRYSVATPAGVFYMKNLWSWDSGAYSTYKVLYTTNDDGTVIMILYDCGNIVTIDKYIPPPPPPPKEISCTSLTMNVSNGAKVEKGKRIELQGRAAGKNVAAGETVDMYYEMVDLKTGQRVGAQQVAPGVPFKSGSAKDPVERIFTADASGRFQFRLTVQYEAGGKQTAPGSATASCIKTILVNESDVCPNKPGRQDASDDCDECPNVEGIQGSTSECDVCKNIDGEQSDESMCKPCDRATSENDPSVCLIYQKTASNTTQKIDNADGTTAAAGDVIEYSLAVTNTGKVRVNDFVVEEDITDILQYADVESLHGGKLGENSVVTWPKTDIEDGKTITKKLTIKIKDPIPDSPISSSDPSSFDLTLTNVYKGQTVNILLPQSIVKTTEQITRTIPNTGPGSSLAITFGITMVAGYLFARSRLLTKELGILKTEYAGV